MADYERSQSNEYKAIYVWSIDNLDSLMEMKKRILSNQFTCPDDPKQVKFHIESQFGGEEDGWLSAYVSTTEDATCFVPKFTFTAYDEDMVELDCRASSRKSILTHQGRGWKKFYSLSRIRDSSSNLIRIKCEIVYNGDPVKTDSTTIKPRDPNLPQNMIALLDSSENADVTFIVGDKKIKAHKLILIARSEYFKKLFNSGRQEECAENMVEIRNAESLEFKEFLKFLYSGLPPKNLPEIAMSLLPLADRYGNLVLKEMCVSAIRGSLSPSNVIEVLLLSDVHDCQDLTKICIPIFKRNVKELKKTASWNSLMQKSDIISKILASLCQ